MDGMEKQNANPTVYQTEVTRQKTIDLDELDREDDEMGGGEGGRDAFDDAEVFEMIRNIDDPEHPLTLEQLKVATLDQVHVVDDEDSTVDVMFTPTIPHCSMATLIGLCIRVKLLRSLPARFKVKVSITPGTHSSEEAVNKQLNDKERVLAALENTHLSGVVNKCIGSSDR